MCNREKREGNVGVCVLEGDEFMCESERERERERERRMTV